MGGYNGGGPYLDTNEEYNPETDTWTYKTPMPIPMGFFGITVHQGKIYCISGENGSTFAYTPLTDTWETKTPLPNPREGITANTIENKIYVIGGESNITDVYDPINDSWSTKASMPYDLKKFKGWTCASTVFDNKIHVFGLTSRELSHQIYDTTSNSWSLGKPSNELHFFAIACATSGVNAPKRIYVFGNDANLWTMVAPTHTSQSYDPKTDSWINTNRISFGHLIGGVANIEDRLYVIGGGSAEWAGIIRAENENDMYTPIDYGLPDPSYIPPASTPTPTLSPTPTQTPIPTPSLTPEPEPFPTTIVLASAIIVIVGLGILTYFNKRKT